MAFTVLTGVRLFAVGADLTGYTNKVELSAEREEKDKTTYGSSGWKEVMAGLGSAELTGEGFWDAGADGSFIDNASWAQLGGLGAWTVAPLSANVGDLAYLMKAHRADYNFGGQVGDIAPWKGKATSTWPLARGAIAHPPGTARTSSGSGTGVQLGAVASGQRLYGSLHVLSASGTLPTLNVIVESGTSNAFSSPTTQLTFTQGTTTGDADIQRTSGSAITDTWFRVSWTIAGTNPSFLFAAAFGIQ